MAKTYTLYTTESGGEYVVAWDRGLWMKVGNHGGFDKIWSYGTLPSDYEGEVNWDDITKEKPVVGKRLYFGSRYQWRISSEVVKIEELSKKEYEKWLK